MTEQHDDQGYETPVVDDANADYVVDKPKDTSDTSEVETKDEEVQESKPTYARSSSNTTLKFPVYRAIPKRMDKWIPLQCHSRRFSEVSENLSAWAQVTDDTETNTHLKTFIEAFAGATELSIGLTHNEETVDGKTKYKGWFETTLSDKERNWCQGIVNEKGDLITPTRPSNNVGKRRVIEGSAAKERTLNAIGIGLGLRTPLPHTGFTIGFSSPTGSDISALNYALQLERARSAFTSEGMIFSNVNYGRIEKAWEFAEKYIIYTNIQGWVDIDLGDVIKCTDLPIINWALSCTVFPDGHPLEIPCGNDPNVCGHVEKINLDIFRTFWVDNNGLSKDQIKMLGNGNSNYPLSALDKYSQEAESNLSHSFVTQSSNGSTFKITCKIPTINEYLRAGEEWVSSAEKVMDGIFDRKDISAKARQSFIENHTSLTALRGYSPWIKEIVINDLEVINQEGTIVDALEGLSNDDVVTTEVLKEVQKFIERATVALVAIPTCACSKCGFDASNEENTLHPELTPIDPFKLFFELGDRRLTIHQAGLIT